MDSGTKGVSVQRPCVDVAVHLLKRGQGLGQALSGKDTNFNLCHIQPGGVNGSIVDLQALYDPPGLSRFKSFIQRRNRVDIQIVHNQQDFFAVAVMDIHQFTQEMGKIDCSSGACKFYDSFAGQRFKGNKQVHYATAAVLVVFSSKLPGFAGIRRFSISCRLVSSRQTTGRRGS